MSGIALIKTVLGHPTEELMENHYLIELVWK